MKLYVGRSVGRDRWYVMDSRGVSYWFSTWREAMDHALAQARLDRQEQCS